MSFVNYPYQFLIPFIRSGLYSINIPTNFSLHSISRVPMSKPPRLSSYFPLLVGIFPQKIYKSNLKQDLGALNLPCHCLIHFPWCNNRRYTERAACRRFHASMFPILIKPQKLRRRILRIPFTHNGFICSLTIFCN